MKFNFVIGMDMSKEHFDLEVHNFDFAQRFANTPKGIRKMLKTLRRVLNCDLDHCLFCFEHTGLYSMQMIVELESESLKYCVIPGLELKKSQGMTRGKSDPMDARRIAEYAYEKQDKLTLSKMPSKSIRKLKHLLSMRSMHVRQRASYSRRMNEQFRVMKKTEYPAIYHSQKRMLKQFEKEIVKIEEVIEKLVGEDVTIKRIFDLLVSIKGVGKVVALNMIVKTNGFVSFTEWRKFACYCGTAPFPNDSGKQIKVRRISKIGDGEMKTLLTLSARTMMQHDSEIRLYVERKLSEGKTKKNVTNSIRNKLLSRMFAVVKRGTPYVTLHKFAS